MSSHPFISFLHLQVASLCLEGSPLSGYYIIYRRNLKYNKKRKNGIKHICEDPIHTKENLTATNYIDINVMLDFFLFVEIFKLILLSLLLFTSLIFILDITVLIYIRVSITFF